MMESFPGEERAREMQTWANLTLDISSSWLARCARQCMHEYVRWHEGRYACGGTAISIDYSNSLISQTSNYPSQFIR